MHIAIALGVGLAVGLLNGLLAVGGTLLIPSLVRILKFDQHQAHGTSLWIILPTSAVSLSIYLFRQGVFVDIGWKIALGGAAGAIIGAKLMTLISGLWLKRIFAGFMLIAALRMIIG